MQRLADYGLRGCAGPTTTAASTDTAALHAEARRIAAEYRRRTADKRPPDRTIQKSLISPAQAVTRTSARRGSLPPGRYVLPDGTKRDVGAAACAQALWARKVRQADKHTAVVGLEIR
jgi:hypothetical protein